MEKLLDYYKQKSEILEGFLKELGYTYYEGSIYDEHKKQNKPLYMIYVENENSGLV